MSPGELYRATQHGARDIESLHRLTASPPRLLRLLSPMLPRYKAALLSPTGIADLYRVVVVSRLLSG